MSDLTDRDYELLANLDEILEGDRECYELVALLANSLKTWLLRKEEE